MNPELRQTLNVLSHNFENANQTAQENIYTFTQLYIDPCLSGFKSCFQDCTAPCFPTRDNAARRRHGRGRSRGQAEYFFDFYDDWDDEEDLIGAGQSWGNDELDSLLAGQGQPPKRPRGMSYGSKGRRKPGPMQPSDAEEDPTLIPGSSYLGFLERLPFKIGARVLKYKPSAANLQEHPGVHRSDFESQPLLEEEGYGTVPRGHTRKRSATQNSRSTTNSLSSRGDLILSDEEEDAVALDDEFAVMLSRRTTNTDGDQQSSGKSSKRGMSRLSTQRTVSSKSTRSQKSNNSTPSKRSRSQKDRNFTSPGSQSPGIEEVVPFPSMRELRQEEDDARQQEELEIQQKRDIAQRLAVERGLHEPVASQSSKEVSTTESIDLGVHANDGTDAPQDDPLGETRSITDVDNSTDHDADIEDLSMSRDTFSSGPGRTSSEASLNRSSHLEPEPRNEQTDPP